MDGIDLGNIILSYVVFIFSLTLHELGHAWTSEQFGDDTSRYLGRVSLNPLVHMDPIGTVLFPLIGAFTGAAVLGWAKPVPVDPLLWRNKTLANIAVSAAGPLANLLIVLITVAIVKVLISQGIFIQVGTYYFVPLDPTPAMEAIQKLLFFSIVINIGLAVFNMIPIPPLDGSHILSSILSVVAPPLLETYEKLSEFSIVLFFAFIVINRQLHITSYLSDPLYKLVGIILQF